MGLGKFETFAFFRRCGLLCLTGDRASCDHCGCHALPNDLLQFLDNKSITVAPVPSGESLSRAHSFDRGISGMPNQISNRLDALGEPMLSVRNLDLQSFRSLYRAHNNFAPHYDILIPKIVSKWQSLARVSSWTKDSFEYRLICEVRPFRSRLSYSLMLLKLRLQRRQLR